MLRYRLATLLVALLLICPTSTPAQDISDVRLRLTLEDIHASTKFAPKGFQVGKWAAAGPVVTYVEDDSRTGATHLISYNLETGEQERLIDGARLYARDVERLIQIEDYAYSRDASLVLIYTDSERVWRHNTKGTYYVFDVETETLTPVSSRDEGFQMFAKFSPDGRHVAFVRDRNLFAVRLDNFTERQLTFDGSVDGIINGTTDWVYEEEFGLRDGWAWSPDSRHIAFVQLDESATRQFMMLDLRGQYPDETRFKYPKAGETNSEIRVGVIDVTDGTNTFFETGTWFAGGDSLEYIPQFGWTPEVDGRSRVWMFRMNRDQNELDLLYGDPAGGSVKAVLEEENDTWLEVETSFGDLAGGTITYLDNGQFVWLSERDGYRHLYLYRIGGEFVRQLTSGDWNVTSFHGIDLTRDAIYFTGTVASPLERHLYRTPFGGRSGTNGRAERPEQISKRSGTHRVDMSRDLRYYIDRFSNVSTPSVTTLHTANGDLIRVLEGNEELQQLLEAYELPEPEFIEVPAADGSMLNAYLLKPGDFDASRQYPLLMYVYGGPGSQEVTNQWGGGRHLWHAYLAEEKDVLIAVVDNRGTGGRSKEFKSATYKQLGVLEAEDQIAAARYLGDLPFVDAGRIGIWGWSYGGYMTLLSMLYGDGPDVFKAGMSVAPVTDWRQYDTIYTERYMSTPQKNPEGYDAGSPVRYADRLRNEQELLIVHGDLDDNVHLQNAIQMVEALQESGKQFELMIYPGRNHGIYGGNARLHLYTLLTKFIHENLLRDSRGSTIHDPRSPWAND